MESSSLREKIKVQLIRHFMNTQAIRIFGVGWQKWNEHKIQLRFEILRYIVCINFMYNVPLSIKNSDAYTYYWEIPPRTEQNRFNVLLFDFFLFLIHSIMNKFTFFTYFFIDNIFTN